MQNTGVGHSSSACYSLLISSPSPSGCPLTIAEEDRDKFLNDDANPVSCKGKSCDVAPSSNPVLLMGVNTCDNEKGQIIFYY